MLFTDFRDFINEEFKSKRQQRYFYAMANKKGKKGRKFKKMAKEFSDATDFSKLPESLESYKTQLFNFLDYPWQEDTEIDIVNTVSEYRDTMTNASEHACRSYLKNFKDANARAFLNTTDAFETAYDNLS